MSTTATNVDLFCLGKARFLLDWSHDSSSSPKILSNGIISSSNILHSSGPFGLLLHLTRKNSDTKGSLNEDALVALVLYTAGAEMELLPKLVQQDTSGRNTKPLSSRLVVENMTRVLAKPGIQIELESLFSRILTYAHYLVKAEVGD